MTEISATCETDRSPSSEGFYPSPELKGSKDLRKDRFSVIDTPVKKNKRKLSEPRKRTDFSIKRFCPDSPGGGSAGSESGRSDDVQEDPPDSPGRSNESPGQDSNNSQNSHSLSEHDVTATSVYPRGMFLFPGHIPPNYMIPPIYKHHPAFLPQGAGLMSFPRMDMINNTTQNVHSVNSEPQNPPESDFNDTSPGTKNGKKSRKNYKNMTRERRVEANARERTRVHTISAAFEALRRAVPSYSYNQKLSKLAILRIASSYIMALGKLADCDVEEEQNRASFGELVDMCTRTIQTEGRARRRH